MSRLTRAQRTLLEKAANHPHSRVVGCQDTWRLALVNAGLIQEDGERYNSAGTYPLYKITDKGRAAVKGPMAKKKTTKSGKITRTISIGVMAPACAKLRVSKVGDDDWEIIEVISVVANDATPRVIMEHADDATLAEVDRLAELAEDDEVSTERAKAPTCKACAAGLPMVWHVQSRRMMHEGPAMTVIACRLIADAKGTR